MKVFSRDFTLKEKILLLAMALILLALGYYYFIDEPVRSGIASAEADYQLLSDELGTIQMKIVQLENMKQELESLADDPTRMPSYNASKEEIALLNDILAGASEYTITFSDVTRDGDQIRRNFTLQFVAGSYATARDLLEELEGSELRCRLGDLYFSSYDNTQLAGTVRVSATATFYETMVGGTPDAGLPADTSAANTDNSETEYD